MPVHTGLAGALSDGSIELIDLTTPLTSETQLLRLFDPFANTDKSSLSQVTQGGSARGAKWMAETASISGFGVETVGSDDEQAGACDPVFPAHEYLLKAGRYGATSQRNLTQPPSIGAMTTVAPLPIVGGSGSRARVYTLGERS